MKVGENKEKLKIIGKFFIRLLLYLIMTIIKE